MARKIQEISNADATAKIYKDSDTGEFRVSLWRNGAKIDGADYFTDDKADAESTACVMVGAPVPSPKPEIIFASGTRGHNVRADGNGGTLARGYYVRVTAENGKPRTIGPFSRKADARAVADLAAVEIDGIDYNRETREFSDIRVRPFVISARDDSGALAIVSAENGDGFADYYGEFRGGYPWIAPALESFATERGLEWQWENPGAIALYRA